MRPGRVYNGGKKRKPGSGTKRSCYCETCKNCKDLARYHRIMKEKERAAEVSDEELDRRMKRYFVEKGYDAHE